MTPAEAEKIFYEFGDALSNKWMTKPEKYGPHLRCVSRAGLRKAILLWVAKQKFDGVDILYRREMQAGQRVAVLELADNVWWFTCFFGPVQDGLPVLESSDESTQAARLHDEFIKFLQRLDSRDPSYWQKIEAKLDGHAA
jgi:hypothetical protein